jgi:hypothetical protein
MEEFSPNFASEIECAHRLILEYNRHGNVCIAFDYDNTLFDCHGNSPKNMQACLDLMKRCQDKNIDLVLWTCSNKDRWININSYLGTKGIHKYWINETKDKYKIVESSPKPFFSLLLDDRAGLGSAMRTLSIFLNTIK